MRAHMSKLKLMATETSKFDDRERDTHFFYAEQRCSTDKSSRNYYPMTIIPKYDWKSKMP